MKNQRGRQSDGRRAGQDPRGTGQAIAHADYRHNSEDDSQHYPRGHNDQGNRRRNDWPGGNDGFGVHNRRGETYGFGSQEDDEFYEDLGSRERNAGSGNRGGNPYGNQGGHPNREHRGTWHQGRSGEGSRGGSTSPSSYPNYGNLDQADMNEALRHAHGNGINRSGKKWEPGMKSNKGKGPKGFRRSDERIRETINDILTDDDQLDASEIEVSVQDGDVTLSGIVAEKDSKRRAEELVESVSGVSNVENRIRVSKDTSKTGARESTREPQTDEVRHSERGKSRRANPHA
jgi:hypothetical protein